MRGYEIPEKLLNEIDELSILIKKKLNNEIDPVQFRAKRVAFGIYEQRINDTFMIRIRCPAGLITPSQLMTIANLAKKYGSGRLHITTRQELQLHSVEIEKIPEILTLLYETELSTRGGGGNTVRNIVAPADSGICPDEIFDVSSYAIGLTSMLIKFDNSWNLPRKFKINFSHNEKDTGLSRVADLGFIATKSGGEDGFIVYAGGGMGIKSAIGHKMIDFIPAIEVGNVAEALKRMFFDHGNRKNRHQARLRFLRDRIGIDEFNRLFNEYYKNVKNENLHFAPLFIENKIESSEIETRSLLDSDKNNFESWKERFVSRQKQDGLYSIKFPLLLGDIDSDLLLKFAYFLIPYGENVIRFTTDQGILIRNILEKYLVNFYYFWKENFSELPYFSGNLTVCAGADTCKLGLCLSRGLAKILLERLEIFKTLILDDKFPRINISGCPNCCGQHWLGDIGFYGFAARKEDKLYPAYYVVTGYENTPDSFKFGERLTEINARDLPEFLTKTIELYLQNSEKYINYRDFVNKESEKIKELSTKFVVPSFKVDKNYYYDWGSDQVFSLAERSTGECSAGFFDFIERDLAKIEEYKRLVNSSQTDEELYRNLKALVYFSSRMLLITRGIEAEKDEEVYSHFIREFIDKGYIEDSYKEILSSIESIEKVLNLKNKIIKLSEDVKKLYDSMDTNFQFSIDRERKIVSQESKKEDVKRFKDLRGVACPMNFVKTKLELSFIQSGELLEVYLDEGEPIQNVPGSIKEEGHKILSIEKKGDYYSVIIKKA